MSNVKTIYPFSNHNIESLSAKDVLHVYDVFDEDKLCQLLDKIGHPLYIVNDSCTFYNTQKLINIFYINLWLEREVNFFKDCEFSDNLVTNHVANLLINKKQINRYLALKFVEIFNLDVNYTWNGIGSLFNLDAIAEEINLAVYHQRNSEGWISAHDKGCLFAPLTLEPRWINFSQQYNSGFAILNYGGNRWTWDNGIGNIVSTSAISIITESIEWQPAMHFSEKTLYSVLGLTFPIWVGGFRQADEWKKYGFDTFDDIIDHSYQHCLTLFERCWWAIKKNEKLLTDKNLVAQIRQDNLQRLQNNRTIMLNDCIKKYNDQLIKDWPQEVTNNIDVIKSRLNV